MNDTPELHDDEDNDPVASNDADLEATDLEVEGPDPDLDASDADEASLDSDGGIDAAPAAVEAPAPEPARAEAPVAGVRFIEAGPITYCSPGDLALGVGDYVVVRTDRGERLGWVVLAPDQILAGRPDGPLRVVDRLASEADVEAWEHGKERAKEDFHGAQALAARNDPRLRVASLVYDLDTRYAELTFTAPERVEHRWLDQQLSDLLNARVSVTQVGDRDRAKAAQGFDVCGLALCCSTWMTEFPSISIRMAKDQDLPPNPSKISGVCGRLLCCLSYEVEAYRELRGDLPKVGKRVTTPVGRAKVISMNSLKQLVRLRLDDSGEIIELAADELRKQYGNAVRPEELEAQVEEPVRRRDRTLRDDFVAVIAPVDAPTIAAARPLLETGELTVIGDSVVGDAVVGDTEAGDAPRKRRRRGRRGGRGRHGPGEGGTNEAGGTDEAGDDAGGGDE